MGTSLKAEISGETTETTKAISPTDSPDTNSSPEWSAPFGPTTSSSPESSVPRGRARAETAPSSTSGSATAQGLETDGFYLESTAQTKTVDNASLNGLPVSSIESTTYNKTACNVTLNGVAVTSIESTSHTKTSSNVTLNGVQVSSIESTIHTKTAGYASLNGVPLSSPTRPAALATASRVEQLSSDQNMVSKTLLHTALATKVSATPAVVTHGDVAGVPYAAQGSKSLPVTRLRQPQLHLNVNASRS